MGRTALKLEGGSTCILFMYFWRSAVAMASIQVDHVKYVHAISVQCIFSQALCSLLTNCNDNQGK